MRDLRKQRPTRGFTIIEMMIVIVIIGILVAIGMPAFNGISRGSKTKGSVSNLQTTMSLARQWAITHHERAYVVFPDNTVAYASNAEAEESAYRSYNVYTVSEDFIGDWRYLPEGVIFDPTFEPKIRKNLWSGTNREYVTIDGKTYACLVFKPDGTILPFEQKEVFMAEGWVEVDGGGIPSAVVKPDNRMVFSVDIYPLTGLVRIREYNDFI